MKTMTEQDAYRLNYLRELLAESPVCDCSILSGDNGCEACAIGNFLTSKASEITRSYMEFGDYGRSVKIDLEAPDGHQPSE